MTSAALPCYRFGAFELQPAERRLLSGGTPVHLGPHAFDLLVALVERSGHLVTKDELLARVWGKVVVEENTLQAHISVLRKLIGQPAIATVTGQGYRFTAAVTPIHPAPARRNHNLPHALTRFIGREREIAQVQQLLGTTRLLTLTGTGGCGKTRLAFEIGAQRVDAYADGVWLVELAAVNDAGLVGQTIAKALEINEQPGKSLPDTLCAAVAPREVLLILDNAEHLLDACAQIADVLLHRCARLAILCTSRERLGITGELTYRVPSLAVPDACRDPTPEQISECESVRLFVERAHLQDPHFALTAANAGAVSSICRRLDGIALAIELAAARVRSMSVDELGAGLDERFRLLTEGSRTALPRHRTLRSLIDWSYELLSESERMMLCRVSVFSGGWSLEAARQVCAFDRVAPDEAASVLTSLADKSLVWTEMRDAVTRFRLLETVRQYAHERLQRSGEETPVRRRHVEYFVALAEEARKHELAADAPAWLDRLEMEHDNFRAALRASCSARLDHGDAGLKLAGLLQWLWTTRGYWAEGREWISMALGTLDASKDEEARARALRGLAAMCQLQGDLSSARRSYEQSFAIEARLCDPRRLCITLYNLANVTALGGDHQRAADLYERSLAIAREIGERPMIAMCMGNLARTLAWKGDIAAARACAEEALATWRSLGDLRGSHALCFLATLTRAAGDFGSAAAMAEEALAMQRKFGDRLGLSGSLLTLAAIRIDMRETERAVPLLQEAAKLWHELDDHAGLSAALQHCAVAAFALQGPLSAARIWGHAEKMSTAAGRLEYLPSLTWNERYVAAARTALADDVAFDRAWNEGREMDADEIVRYALAVLSEPNDASSF